MTDRIGSIATVEVDGRRFTGRVYHVNRYVGWPCVQCADGHVASGPEVLELSASELMRDHGIEVVR